MLCKKAYNCILNVSYVNARIMAVRLSAAKFNITIINAYAPTEDAEDRDKDEFYQALTQCLHSLPGHDIKVILTHSLTLLAH